jgi:hypothetical protein
MENVLTICIGDRNEVKRLAGILILKTLCQHAPTLMYGYVTQFLQLIWVALRDIKVYFYYMIIYYKN